jgi:chromosomal replication initiator protein
MRRSWRPSLSKAAARQETIVKSCAGKGEKVRAMLRARLGEDIYTSWFAAMEFDNFDGRVVRATVPVKFLKSWIQSHYADDLLECCAAEFTGAERVDLPCGSRASPTAPVAAIGYATPRIACRRRRSGHRPRCGASPSAPVRA